MLSSLCALAIIAGIPLRVIVPTSTVVERCVVEEQIAARLLVTEGVRVSRRELRDIPEQGVWQIEVEFTSKGDLQIERTTREGRFVGPRLDAVWPKSAPPLSPDHLAFGIPNEAALEAACKGDGRAAYRHSGAAFGRTIARMVTPPNQAQKGSLLVRWAWASATLRRNECKAALPILQQTIAALENHRLGPIWRRPPPPGRVPSALVVGESVVIVFEEGDFVAFDRSSGQPVWRNIGGPAEPRPLLTPDGAVFIVREGALLELDAKTGRVRWQRAMVEPQSELVIARDVVFAADQDNLMALSRTDGQPRWTFDGLASITAGPVAIGAYLAIPIEHRLVVLHRSGAAVFEVPLSDEISAPLIPSGGDRVWALVGSDEVALVDLNRRKVIFSTNQIPGIVWPPAVLGPALAVAIDGKTSQVGFIQPSHGRQLLATLNAQPTVQAFHDFSGVIHTLGRDQLVKRDADGKIRWRTKLGGAIVGFDVAKDAVVAGAGSEITVLDSQSGHVLEKIDLDGSIVDITNERFGGAVLLKDGTLYGLPGARDPQRSSWLTEARHELAHCLVREHQETAARKVANVLLARNPDDLEALAIKARSVTTPATQFQAWWELARKAPITDPLTEEARAGLGKIGAVDWVELNSPARSLVGTSSGAVVLQLASGIEVRAALEPDRVLWSLPGALLGETADTRIEVDGKWVDSWTGEPAEPPQKPASKARIDDRRLDKSVPLRARTPGRLAVIMSERFLVLLAPEP